jgi:ribosomal protein S12 methylthiotransferase accessory factor
MEVIVDYKDGWKFAAQCGNHAVIADLPQEQKGSDAGPTPPQYFLVSLASCIGVYVLGFCNNSGLDATGMQIKITADKLQQPARMGNIKMEVSLPNAQVGKRKEALLSVARKCLVHNTIADHPEMLIDLVSP